MVRWIKALLWGLVASAVTLFCAAGCVYVARLFVPADIWLPFVAATSLLCYVLFSIVRFFYEVLGAHDSEVTKFLADQREGRDERNV